MSVPTGSQRASGAEEPFFHHGHGGAMAAGQALQNATRYLSAAVYLDRRLCDRVLAEYVDGEHRAVAPSFGFDLGPVIVHALRGRRYRLARDTIIVAAWAITAVLNVKVAIGVCFLLLVLSAFYLVPWDGIPRRWRVAGAVIAVFSFGVPLLAVIGGVMAGVGGELVKSVVQGSVGLRPFMLLLLFLTMPTAIIGHIVVVYRVLARDLAPGAVGPDTGGLAPRTRRMLDRVCAAQRGNVTMYSAENPFLGAGKVAEPWGRVWSIVVELDRPSSGPFGVGPGEQRAARVDPVVLHQRVRARLQGMRDERPPRTDGPPDAAAPLPTNERIPGLVTDMHVVSRGECLQQQRPLDGVGGGGWYVGHPLIDPRYGIPFSVATPAAIDAIIRHPAGGVRCYQRVTIGAQGQLVMDSYGRPVVPAEDQDIALSTFVYLAVEGRMLYAQLAAAALPPIRREFRVVDVLPDWRTRKLVLRALAVGWRGLVSGMLLGAPRLAAAGFSKLGALLGSTVNPTQQIVHDYGTSFSIRELAAEHDFHTFVQELDADKYTRLIERRVNEAVLDYLDGECGIDVSSYRAQADVVLNEGVIMTGGSVTGQVAAGGTIDQSQKNIKP